MQIRNKRAIKFPPVCPSSTPLFFLFEETLSQEHTQLAPLTRFPRLVL